MALPTLLFVCGSLQRASANRAALDVAAAALDGHAQVEWADELAAIAPFNPDTAPDSSAAVDSFRSRISECDAVVIATPEYAGAMAGGLKNALDWIVGTGEFHGKLVGILSAGTSGGALARADLRRTLAWHGAHTVADLGVASPRPRMDTAGRFVEPATLTEIRAFALAVVSSLDDPPRDQPPR